MRGIGSPHSGGFLVRPICIDCIVSLVVFIFAAPAPADVTAFTDMQAWQSAVGEYVTIDFTGFPNNTLITNQYASLGVHFTDGADFIHLSQSAYPNDGAGLRGGIPRSITIEFIAPIQWIAMDFPGRLWVELYFGNTILFDGGPFGSGGFGNFAGLVSTTSFDKVRLFHAAGAGASVDDLYFGPPIPAPGAIGLLGASVLCGWRRRRRL